MGWRGCGDNASFRSRLWSLSGLCFLYFLIKLNARPAWSDTCRDFFHFFTPLLSTSHPFFFEGGGDMLLLEMRPSAPPVFFFFFWSLWKLQDTETIISHCVLYFAFDLLRFICIFDAFLLPPPVSFLFRSCFVPSDTPPNPSKKRKNTQTRTFVRQP